MTVHGPGSDLDPALEELWAGFDLAGELGAALGVPARIGNDANAKVRTVMRSRITGVPLGGGRSTIEIDHDAVAVRDLPRRLALIRSPLTGVALHDLADPARVPGVADPWILEPTDPWEHTGSRSPTSCSPGGALLEPDGGTIRL